MKQSYTLLLLLVMMLAASCKKDKVSPSPVSQLPPITTEGKNTFGCLVNGKAFMPRGSMWSGQLYECYYQYSITEDIYVFQVAGFDKEDPKRPAVFVRTYGTELQEGIIYKLEENQVEGQGLGELYLSATGRPYATNKQFKGELKINRFDEEEQIVSGTFWFDAVNDAGEKVEVREGRFDMQYHK